MTTTVGLLSAVALGVYTARAGTGIVARAVEARIGKPALVRETTRAVEHKIKTYKQLHARMGWVPDTTMWIDTPIDDCMKRIEERGRESESGISRDYIEKLRNLYEDLMRTTPNIRVDGSRSASDVVLEIKKHIEKEGYLGV